MNRVIFCDTYQPDWQTTASFWSGCGAYIKFCWVKSFYLDFQKGDDSIHSSKQIIVSMWICYHTPPFPSSAFCLLVAPCQAIDSKHLSSIVNRLPSKYQECTNQLPSMYQECTWLTVEWYMLGTCLADGWLCLTSACCQSLDKEQQANRKCLTEMVV